MGNRLHIDYDADMYKIGAIEHLKDWAVSELNEMHKPTWQLTAMAAVSLSIYALAFVWHYSLLEWWAIPQETIAKITSHDPLAGASYVIAVAVLFFLYLLACRITRGHHHPATWSVVIAGALAFNAMLMLLYPVDAADIFDNIVHGRTTAIYGANPFYQAPVNFRQDPFYDYVGWVYYPSAYGPGWELIAAGAARLAGNDFIVNVLAFKMIGVLAYVGTAVLIALTLRRQALERALSGMVLYAWNPLVLYVTAGNGHNDAVMVLFIALGFYLLAVDRLTLAAIALTIGASIKFIPALLLPVVLVVGLKQAREWRARVFFLLVTLVACALIFIGLYAPFWRGGDILGLGRRSDLLTTSLPTLIQVTLEPLGESFSVFLATRFAAILLAAWIILQMLKLWQSSKLTSATESGASILLFYLLVTCLWFQPWYAIWPLVVVALLPDSTLGRGALLLSYLATWKMPLFDFVLVPGPTLPPRAWREWWITLGTLGAAWVFFLYQLVKDRMGRDKDRFSIPKPPGRAWG